MAEKTSRKKREPYKKWLGIIELTALAKERSDSSVFIVNAKGECSVEPWLKELRYAEALQLACLILKREVSEQEFSICWANSESLKVKIQTTPEAPPNTATFGGYRSRLRNALNRDQKANRQPKKGGKRW